LTELAVVFEAVIVDVPQLKTSPSGVNCKIVPMLDKVIVLLPNDTVRLSDPVELNAVAATL